MKIVSVVIQILLMSLIVETRLHQIGLGIALAYSRWQAIIWHILA